MKDQKVKKSPKQENLFIGTFGKRLRVIRESLGLTRAEASRLIEVSPSTLQAWEEESSRLPNAWNLRNISRAYKIDIESLYSDSELHTATTIEDEQGHIIDLEEFVFIPRYNVTAAAGDGSAISAENIMHHMAFRKYWVDNVIGAAVKDLVVIGVAGDSMEGEINNGDAILINTADKKLNNGIYVVRINGDLIVKRIQKLVGGVIRIISANPAYDSFDINLDNLPTDFEAIGRVVWHGRNVP